MRVLGCFGFCTKGGRYWIRRRYKDMARDIEGYFKGLLFVGKGDFVGDIAGST